MIYSHGDNHMIRCGIRAGFEAKDIQKLFKHKGTLPSHTYISGIKEKMLYRKYHKDISGKDFRLCNSCNSWKEYTCDFFHKKGEEGKLHSTCKMCKNRRRLNSYHIKKANDKAIEGRYTGI